MARTHGDLLLKNCHSLIAVYCVIAPSNYHGATMSEYHSLPPDIQLVWMFNPLIPTYTQRRVC